MLERRGLLEPLFTSSSSVRLLRKKGSAPPLCVGTMRAYRSGFAAVVSFKAVFYIFSPELGPPLRAPTGMPALHGWGSVLMFRVVPRLRGVAGKPPSPYTLAGAHASAPGMRISARLGHQAAMELRGGGRTAGDSGGRTKMPNSGGRRRSARPPETWRCFVSGAPPYFWGQPTGAGGVPPANCLPSPSEGALDPSGRGRPPAARELLALAPPINGRAWKGGHAAGGCAASAVPRSSTA